MPWTAGDVAKHNKMADTPRLKRIWVAAANNALATCERDGGTDCEGRAIRIANAAVRRAQESYVAPSLHDSLAEAAKMLAQDDSYGSRISVVSDAVRKWAVTKSERPYSYDYSCYINDLYDDAVVFSYNHMLHRASYEIDDDNKVTLGEPERVKLYYAPVSATSADESWQEVEDPARLFVNESFSVENDELTDDTEETTESIGAQEEMLVESDCIPLTESAVKADGTAKICVITPGWGSTGYYSAEMLERDAPKVFPQGTHMHWDHPTPEEMNIRPEGKLDSLAGVLTESAYWDADGPNGAGVYADVKVFEKRQEVLNEIAPYIGVSIKAPGMVREGTAEGRKGKIVESLVVRPTNAVDFVTIPGRGGRVVDLVESARAHVEGPVTRKSNRKDEVNDMDNDQIQALIQESVKTAVAAAVTEATADANKTITQLEATVARQADALRARDMREIAAIEVAKYQQLGERARARVLDLATVGEAPLTEAGALDTEKIKESVKRHAEAEIEYLKAEAGATGRVKGMGASSTPKESVTEEDAAKALLESAKLLGMSDEQAKVFAGIK